MTMAQWPMGGGSMPEIDVTTASCLLNETLTARTPPLSTRLQRGVTTAFTGMDRTVS